MTHLVLQTSSPVRAPALWLLFALLCASLACSSGNDLPELELIDQGEPRALEEATLVSGELHRWTLPLPKDEFVRLLVEQRDIDVALRLIDPSGEVLSEVDGPGGPWIEERLAWVTSTAGDYHLEITASETGRGDYRLRLAEQRPEEPQDDGRIRAEAFFQQGRHQRHVAEGRAGATKSLRQAADLWKSLGEAERHALALDELADLLLEIGDYQTAVDFLHPISTDDPTTRAKILETRGFLNFYLENESQAEEDLFESLALARETGDSLQRAYTLDALTSFHLGQDDTEENREAALATALEALEIREGLGDRYGLSTTLSNLAVVRRRLSNARVPINDLHTRSHTLAQRAHRWAQVGVSWLNLAVNNRTNGRFDDARWQTEEALKIAEQLQEKALLRDSYRCMGQVLHSLQDFENAIPNFEKARDLSLELGPKGPAADAEIRLAATYGALREPEKALLHAQQAVLLAPDEAYYKAYQGRYLRLTHDLEGSREVLLQALEEVSPEDENRRCYVLLELGDTEKELGNTARARTYLEDAFALASALPNSNQGQQYLLTAHTRLARFELEADHLEEAQRHVEKAIVIAEDLRAKLVAPDRRATFASRLVDLNEIYLKVLFKRYEVNPAGGFEGKALEASETVRARALLELLTEAQVDVRAGLSAKLKNEEAEIQAEISRSERAWKQAQSDGGANAQLLSEGSARLAEARQRLEDFEERIRRDHLPFAEVEYPEPMTAPQIQALLEPGTALLEYFLGAEQSYLFVVRRDRLDILELEGEERIADAVRSAREVLEVRSSVRRLYDSHAAYELLVAPALGSLEGIEHLIIAPDRDLHKLPFEALWTSEDRLKDGENPRPEHFLLDTWAVSYVPSAATLRTLQRTARGREPAEFQLAAFAYPGKGPTSTEQTADRALNSLDGELPVLVHATEEVRDLARLFPREQVTEWTDEEATETRIKELAGTGRLLHFAAHGRIDEEAPAQSALIFAESPSDDGRLQVPEIFRLNLQAELAVLSACKTGSGKEVRGEGLIGLSRAFFFAGARSLMVSLWPVEDESTRELMKSFYTGLRNGLDSVESSRRAKHHMVGGNGGEYAHPYHWAPFVLLGPSVSLLPQDVPAGGAVDGEADNRAGV